MNPESFLSNFRGSCHLIAEGDIFNLDKSENEDRDDRNRSDVTDKEPKGSEYLHIGTESTSIGKFVVDICLLESPSYEKDCKKASEGHKDIRRKVVKEVEYRPSEDEHIRKRSERQRAEGSEHPADSEKNRAGSHTGHLLFLDQICSTNLEH